MPEKDLALSMRISVPMAGLTKRLLGGFAISCIRGGGGIVFKTKKSEDVFEGGGERI